MTVIMSGISTIFVLPLFLLMTFAIQFVGVDIIEEKSSKAIETIISSVKASTHFISKIVSSLVFITIQALLLLIFGLIGNTISSAVNNASNEEELSSLLDLVDIYFPNFGMILLFSVLFIIVGAVTYLVIAAVIAASATTQEDYQQFQAPIMITLVIGFYIGIFASTAGAENILKIAAFIPFFAPMTAPTAYALGAMTAFEMVISLTILVMTAGLMIWILGPIYKVAILSYDQTKLIKRLKTYFKKSKALK
jgi:ABC-2 type transport system permease protein